MFLGRSNQAYSARPGLCKPHRGTRPEHLEPFHKLAEVSRMIEALRYDNVKRSPRPSLCLHLLSVGYRSCRRYS
jgi:hypothetical protein